MSRKAMSQIATPRARRATKALRRRTRCAYYSLGPAQRCRAISLPPSTLERVGRMNRVSRGGSIDRRLGCRGALSGRQLNHGRILSRPQTREQDTPPIGEFQRVVVRMGVAQVDLPELGHARPELAQPRQHAAERMVELGLLLEHYFRTR